MFLPKSSQIDQFLSVPQTMHSGPRSCKTRTTMKEQIDKWRRKITAEQGQVRGHKGMHQLDTSSHSETKFTNLYSAPHSSGWYIVKLMEWLSAAECTRNGNDLGTMVTMSSLCPPDGPLFLVSDQIPWSLLSGHDHTRNSVFSHFLEIERLHSSSLMHQEGLGDSRERTLCS